MSRSADFALPPDPPLYLVDAAGHPIELADSGRSVWVHPGPPRLDCQAILAFRDLRNETDPDLRLSWFARKRQLGFEGGCGP
jgi:hypothetical protein